MFFACGRACSGGTALHLAARRGNVDALTLLVQYGTAINGHGQNGWYVFVSSKQAGTRWGGRRLTTMLLRAMSDTHTGLRCTRRSAATPRTVWSACSSTAPTRRRARRWGRPRWRSSSASATPTMPTSASCSVRLFDDAGDGGLETRTDVHAHAFCQTRLQRRRRRCARRRLNCRRA